MAPKNVSCPHTQKPWLFSVHERRTQILIDSNNIACGTNYKRWNMTGDNRCSVCSLPENTKHVLNCCWAANSTRPQFYTSRHDGCLDPLSRRSTTEFISNLVDSRTDLTSPVLGSSLRPDLVNFLTLRRKHIRHVKVLVGDVKCSFPCPNYRENCHERNVHKYEPIAKAYAAAKPNQSAEVVTIIVPTAGPLPRSLIDSIVKMGLSKKDAHACARDMAIAMVRGNYKVVSKGRVDGPGASSSAAPIDSSSADAEGGYEVHDSSLEDAAEDRQPTPLVEGGVQVTAPTYMASFQWSPSVQGVEEETRTQTAIRIIDAVDGGANAVPWTA